MVAPVGKLSKKERNTPIQTERMDDCRDVQGAPEASGQLKRNDRREYEEGRSEHNSHELHGEHHGYSRQHSEERVYPGGVDAGDAGEFLVEGHGEYLAVKRHDDEQDDERKRHRHHDFPCRDRKDVPEKVAEQIDIEPRADAGEQHASRNPDSRDDPYGGVAVKASSLLDLEDRKRARAPLSVWRHKWARP